MKVILLSEVAGLIRSRRSGKTFLATFINHCTTVDAIPVEDIKKVRDEIAKDWYTTPLSNYEKGKKDEALKVLDVIDRLLAKGAL